MAEDNREPQGEKLLRSFGVETQTAFDDRTCPSPARLWQVKLGSAQWTDDELAHIEKCPHCQHAASKVEAAIRDDAAARPVCTGDVDENVDGDEVFFASAVKPVDSPGPAPPVALAHRDSRDVRPAIAAVKRGRARGTEAGHGLEVSGFRLMELLTVAAMIGILCALLLPAIQAAREAARRTQCSNNLKQISLGLNNYHDTFRTFPPAAWNEWNRGNRLAWTVFILPFIEQQALYEEFNFESNNYTGVNLVPGRMLVPTYHCPSMPLKTGSYSGEFVSGKEPYTTHYYAVMGPQGINPMISGGTTRYPESDNSNPNGGYAYGGVLYRNSSIRIADITDGTSNTVMIGEISWGAANCYRTWLRGASGTAIASGKNIEFGIRVMPFNGSNNFNDVSFGSEHPAGCHFAVCDGSVAFVRDNIHMSVLLATASREGAERQTAIRP